MNLPNKLSLFRIIITIFIILILLFPFHALGISSIKIFVNEAIVVDLKYIIAGVLFIIGSVTDFVDGYIARKYNLVTDLGKVLDAIADKVLVNSVLIILSAQGLIHPLIPTIIIGRDTMVNTLKMIVGNKEGAVGAIKSGKIKTTFMMIGISLTLFYNLPFELLNFKVSDLCLLIATFLSIYSAVQYYNMSKKFL